jgi:hypothetical protein
MDAHVGLALQLADCFDLIIVGLAIRFMPSMSGWVLRLLRSGWLMFTA